MNLNTSASEALRSARGVLSVFAFVLVALGGSMHAMLTFMKIIPPADFLSGVVGLEAYLARISLYMLVLCGLFIVFVITGGGLALAILGGPEGTGKGSRDL